MSNKKIYKGLNKRRKFNFKKYITIVLCMTLIIGYTYKKIKLDQVFKNVNISEKASFIKDKLYFWKDLGFEIFNLTSNDTKKSDNLSSKSEDLSQNNSSNNTEVAVVDGMDV